MTTERDRFAKTYRDLDGKELLALYATRDDLSASAVDALRDELKVRGIDPDSLMPTVPKAEAGAEEGAEANSEGDAALAEAPDVPEDAAPPDVPDELKGEFDPTAKTLNCPTCGVDNIVGEERCRACGEPLRGATAAADEPSATESAPGSHPGSLASATLGVIGIAGIAFAAYIEMHPGDPTSIATLTGLVGAACVVVSIVLWSRSKP